MPIHVSSRGVSRRAVGFKTLAILASCFFATTLSSVASADQFVYTTDPPHRMYVTSASGLPQALPPPSVCVAAFGLACYSPQLMRKAYNVPANLDGEGQTIVIVDAYGSPTVREDLAVFSNFFGLPAADLTIVYPGGKPVFNPLQHHDEVSWAAETSLDVQWAHAIAPKAKIVLVIAANNGGNVLNNAQRYAIDNHLGQVMSLSFGAPEAAIRGNSGNNTQIAQAHENYVAAQAAGITVFASTGDFGASDGYPVANASYPASDPLVTAVGGTDLFMHDDGTYASETVWNDSDPALCPFGCTAGIFGATGGAPSTQFVAPSFQQPFTGSNARYIADVSYNASVYTAVMVYIGFFSDPNNNGLYFFGGTSAGSPQWAAITALINQAKGTTQGYFSPALYAVASNPAKYAAAFHDVTIGNNKFFGPGFNASPLYDIPTGLGSPNVAGLIGALP